MTNPASDRETHLSTKQLAAQLDVNPRTVSDWVQQGLPVSSRGGSGRPNLFDVDVVQAWLEEHDPEVLDGRSLARPADPRGASSAAAPDPEPAADGTIGEITSPTVGPVTVTAPRQWVTRQMPVARARRVQLDLPFLETGFFATKRIDGHLNREQAVQLRGLLDGLVQEGARLKRGDRLVKAPLDVIKYLLENLEQPEAEPRD